MRDPEDIVSLYQSKQNLYYSTESSSFMIKTQRILPSSEVGYGNLTEQSFLESERVFSRGKTTLTLNHLPCKVSW
jgi:hypothetical protein